MKVKAILKLYRLPLEAKKRK